MLLEKDAIEIEDAIKILESNGMNSKIHRLGNQKSLITKLVDGYSLMIKDDTSSPDCLCACFNSPKRGVIVTWHEINHKSLVLAIKYVQEHLGIASKQKPFGERWNIVAAAVVSLALVGTSYVLVSNKVAECNTQQSQQPLIKP